ncbi:MAG: hypothetical protein ACKOFM_03625, partial [Actinomycetota bacterium]
MNDPEALIGKVLVGRYRIEALLSDRVAVTKVYEAFDLRHAKKVSMRLIPTSSLVDLESGLGDERAAVVAH